jgi:1-acyl-sn-glycerol-3-phosphate acyltransferase
MVLKYLRALAIYTYCLSMFTFMYVVGKFFHLLMLLNIINKDQKCILYLKTILFVNYHALNLIWWIKIECEGELDPVKGQIIISNHVCLMDTFFITYFLYKKYKYYYQTKILYDSIFDQFTLFRGFSSASDSIPVHTKLTKREEENKYEKEHIDELYRRTSIELAKDNTLIIYFEGKLNNNPKTLNTIQAGAFNISKNNNNLSGYPETKSINKGIFMIGTKNFNKIWHVKSHPTGKGTVTIKCFNKEPIIFQNKEEYTQTIKNTIGKWIAE